MDKHREIRRVAAFDARWLHLVGGTKLRQKQPGCKSAVVGGGGLTSLWLFVFLAFPVPFFFSRLPLLLLFLCVVLC